jgi:hypothetical protein
LARFLRRETHRRIYLFGDAVRKLPERSELTLAPRAFGALSESERHVLQRWISSAGLAGIDSVEDLTSRGWPAAIDGAVIGVFTPADNQAAWLAVGQNGSWAVASCIDGTVSAPVDSLAEALAIVYRAGEGSEWA